MLNQMYIVDSDLVGEFIEYALKAKNSRGFADIFSIQMRIK